MIVCKNCGKQNQDHYKFCLACGAKLSLQASQDSPSVSRGELSRKPGPPPPLKKRAPTPPAMGRTGPKPSVPEPPGLSIPPISKPRQDDAGATMMPGEDPSSMPVDCPSCSFNNPVGFAFCGRCGTKLPNRSPAPAPTAKSQSPVVAAPLRDPTPLPVTPNKIVPSTTKKVRLVLLREDGTEGGSLDIEGGPNVFGRTYGPPFDNDFYLNPEHCAFTVLSDGLFVEDRSPLNGVYRKIEGRFEIQSGDFFRVGQELLMYEDLPEPSSNEAGTEIMGSPNPGYWGRVSVMVDETRAVEAYPIEREDFTIGREQGDISFPVDGYVSSRHCRILGDDSGVFLEDCGSSNGTYLRIRSGTRVDFGTLILVGQQLFRIDSISV